MVGPLIPRFERHISPEPNTGCWLWAGALATDGYGHVRIAGRLHLAHRVAWCLWRGEIPAGLVIDHVCRVRSCVNPDHLRVVTQRENTLAGVGPAARYARSSVCKSGHPYTSLNTRTRINRYGNPTRECRACDRARAIAYLHRKKTGGRP